MNSNIKPTVTNEELNEKLFDALLKIAAEEIIVEEMETLPNYEELNALYPPSLALKKRVRSIISKKSQRVRFKKVMRRITKIAAAFTFAFTICAVVLMSIEASRNYIINLFIGIQDDHVVFDFGQNGEVVNIGEVIVGFVPESFELINSQTFETFSLMIFADSDGEQIVIRKGVAVDLSVAIDNEVRSFSEVCLNGQIAHLFESQDYTESNVIMWQYGNDVFTISSRIAVETLKLMAKNITLR